MADETDTTSEVARVLIDHTRLTFDGKCHCGHQGRLGESFTAHQAEALAEAGLLRDEKATADLGQSIIALLDQVGQQQAQIAAQEPAGATQGESGDSRVSGGLGERLRALMLRAVEPGTLAVPVPVGELRRIAAELDRLEVHARVIEQSLRTARGEAKS